MGAAAGAEPCEAVGRALRAERKPLPPTLASFPGPPILSVRRPASVCSPSAGARPLQPGRARTECPRPFGLAWTTLPPRVRHLDRSEHGIDRMRASFLAAISLAAVRTHALMLQLLDHLLGGHKVLYPMQNRLVFGYAYPQGLRANSALSISATLHRCSPPSWRHMTSTRNVMRAATSSGPGAGPGAGWLLPG